MKGALVFASYLSPSLAPFYQGVADHLAHELGQEVELIEGTHYDQILDGDIDLAFMCSPPYCRMAQRGVRAVVAPVLSGERYGGRPISYSDVIVQARNKATSLEDLEGKRFAYNERESLSGYGAIRAHLAERGGPDFFGAWVKTGAHADSIDRVLDGDVDTAAIDSQVLSVTLRERPELAKRVRVVASIGPNPIQPLVVAPDIDAELCRAITKALVKMHEDLRCVEALVFGQVERFVPVDESHYEAVSNSLSTIAEGHA